MENVEDRLKSYRVRKSREGKVNHIKKSIKDFVMFGIKNSNANAQTEKTTLSIHVCMYGNFHFQNNTYEPTDELLLNSNGSVNTDIDGGNDDILLSEEQLSTKNSKETLILKYILRIMYIALWATLYIIAIELKFGIVFLMFSALIAIYFNTRTGPKRYNEISAYSVFNKNCESIDGTLKAEQLEREIGIR